MDTRFEQIVSAAVRQVKHPSGLLWADHMAERIARATPLSVDRADIAHDLTVAAIREGVPVGMGRSREQATAGR